MDQAVPQTSSIKDKTLANLRRMLDYRRQFDQRRAIFYRQYIGQRDASKYPDNVTNRANTFVPYPLSNVETVVSRVLDAFFSFDPWFEITGTTEVDDHAADAMMLVLGKKLKMANFTDAFEALVRNIAIYGHAAIKVDWNWDFKTLTKPVPVPVIDQHTGQPAINPQTGQPLIGGFAPQTFQVPMACPRIKAIDVYDLLLDPDGGIVAHLTEQPLVEMLRQAQAYKAATGSDLYDPIALSNLTSAITQAYPKNPNEVLVRYAEVWDRFNGTCTVLTYGEDSEAIAWKDLRASYRATAYSPYKRPVYVGAAEVLWHGPNQFDHKRNPILYTSYIKLPNEVFGLGSIEIITDLSESLNKFVNMITDNWNLGINRRFAYDLNADIDHEALNQMNVPGGKVPVNGKPDEVLFPLPFFTPNQGDYALLDLYKGMIETTSGISDFYGKAVGTPRGNDTATGITSVINESNFRFKMFIRNLEFDILQPLLAICCSLIQQYMTDPEEVEITKSPMGPQIPKWQMIQPEQIIGNFEFNMVAANYATNKMVRQRNLMAFQQIAMQSPYWRFGEGLSELGKVMEIHNINDLIKSDQEVQMEQEQAQQHEMQMALLQNVVQTESKAYVNKSKEHPGGTKPKEGRPPKSQFEGKIPGAGTSSIVKSEGQQTGLNAIGLGGMGEIGQG